MTIHEPFSLLYLSDFQQSKNPILSFLEKTPISIQATAQLDEDFAADALLVDRVLQAGDWESIRRFAEAGGGCLLLARPDQTAFPQFAGVQPVLQHPNSEVRVLFQDRQHPLAVHLPDAFYASGPFYSFDIESGQVETLLYADWRYTHQPVWVKRPLGAGCLSITTLHDWRQPMLQRLVYRSLRYLAGRPTQQPSLGVGILGYAPSVGQLHGMGVTATDGLSLKMACDLNPERLAAAQQDFPGIKISSAATDLIDSDEVDLVVIATPPSTHAGLATKMLAGSKHVICEKPLALSRAEAEGMMETAVLHNRHLSCHQNRRWDRDFLAIQNGVAAGWLGDLYYMETFVGGYGHPCGYWHSHDAVSGGTTFDWGAHYLDWMLALMPGEITRVIGTRQNRAWHDITNADRERIQLRYADGSEAEFAHSDLAFIPKPKWYLAGTQGTLIGRWRQETSYTIDPVVYYREHEIPSSELGADLMLRRKTEGGVFEQTLPEPERPDFPFHANLADHLLLGEPLTVPAAHSARVVAILEAAKHSAEKGGAVMEVSI